MSESVGCYQFAPKRYNLDKICFRIFILYFRGKELYLELFFIRMTVNWLYKGDKGEIRDKFENFSKSKWSKEKLIFNKFYKNVWRVIWVLLNL